MSIYKKIYIDTNTISILLIKSEEYVDDLLKNLNKKNIKLYYSILHIREIIHENPKYVQYALNRAKIL